MYKPILFQECHLTMNRHTVAAVRIFLPVIHLLRPDVRYWTVSSPAGGWSARAGSAICPPVVCSHLCGLHHPQSEDECGLDLPLHRHCSSLLLPGHWTDPPHWTCHPGKILAPSFHWTHVPAALTVNVHLAFVHEAHLSSASNILAAGLESCGMPAADSRDVLLSAVSNARANPFKALQCITACLPPDSDCAQSVSVLN